MDIDGWQKKLCSHQLRECLKNICLLENSQTWPGINTKSTAVQHVCTSLFDL
jgi:hypothetical protein